MSKAQKEPLVPLLEESEVVEAFVYGYGNDREFPAFTVPSGRPHPIGNDPGFNYHHHQFIADLAVIAAGGPAKALKDVRKRAGEGADQGEVRLLPRSEGGRRRRRVRFIEPTTTHALQADYVLDIIARGEYARRLTRCALESCGRFFFQDFGKKRPYAYFPDTDHRDQAHKLANPQRAADTRERKKAGGILIREHRVARKEASQLVKGFKGKKAQQIVSQVLATRSGK